MRAVYGVPAQSRGSQNRSRLDIGSIPAFSTIRITEVVVVDTKFMSRTYTGFCLADVRSTVRRVRRTHFQGLLQSAMRIAIRGRYRDGATESPTKRGSAKALYDASQRQPVRLSATHADGQRLSSKRRPRGEQGMRGEPQPQEYVKFRCATEDSVSGAVTTPGFVSTPS